MTQASILIWGAGRIGRGFAADLFEAAGYSITFVDQSETLITSLRQRGQYTVVCAESAVQRRDRMISGFQAYTTTQSDEIAAALDATDLLAVCVFPKDFEAVAKAILPSLQRRVHKRPLDILLFTNMAHASPQFRSCLGTDLSQVGIVETLVIRMVAEPPAVELAHDPLLVWTNGYAELPIDQGAFVGPFPDVPGLRPVKDMRAEEVRKLYTYNTFHAALAYFGWLNGIEKVVDCLADPKVSAAARAVLAESSAALQVTHGFTPENMSRWNAGVISQTNNPTLGDTVRRYASDPRRKLAHTDRLVGPLLMCCQHGLPFDALAHAVAAAFLYTNPNDEGTTEIHTAIRTNGLEAAIQSYCGLSPADEEIIDAICRAYWELLAEKARRLGFQYEQTYHGCGQCAFAAVTETLGNFDKAVFEAATGLAGGLGLVGDSTCGALLGATLAFGLVSPRRRDQFGGDKENKYRAFLMAQKLRQKYLDTYGSICCQDIHAEILGRPFDLRDPAERVAFEAAGAHDDKCTNVVAHAAQWAVEIISEEDRK